MAQLTGEHYDSAFDHIQDGFQLIGFDWKYLYVNEAVVKQSKYPSKHDLVGFTMMEKYPGIEKSEMFKLLQEVMATRLPKSMQNEFKFPDDSTGWFELRVQPVPEGIFILSTDITDHKRAVHRQLDYIQKLEEMMHMTSHKVRQPVAQILGMSNLLNRESNTQQELEQISGGMKHAAQSLDVFTRELTQFIHDVKTSASVEPRQ